MHYAVPVMFERPYPVKVYISKPYPVERKIPYPVHVPIAAPYPVETKVNWVKHFQFHTWKTTFRFSTWMSHRKLNNISIWSIEFKLPTIRWTIQLFNWLEFNSFWIMNFVSHYRFTYQLKFQLWWIILMPLKRLCTKKNQYTLTGQCLWISRNLTQWQSLKTSHSELWR